jgi:S-adenosylmethionine synthetase
VKDAATFVQEYTANVANTLKENQMPDMKKVASSNIDQIGYDKAAKILYVSFLSSGTYQFPDVPEEVFQGLEAAKSKGSYFAKIIRPNYKGEKV